MSEPSQNTNNRSKNTKTNLIEQARDLFLGPVGRPATTNYVEQATEQAGRGSFLGPVGRAASTLVEQATEQAGRGLFLGPVGRAASTTLVEQATEQAGRGLFLGPVGLGATTNFVEQAKEQGSNQNMNKFSGTLGELYFEDLLRQRAVTPPPVRAVEPRPER